MSQFSAIVRSLNAEKFAEILGASSRQAREVYYHRHSIHPPKTKLPKAGAKNEYRNAKLFEALGQEDDEELCEEILRGWLLNKRPLLSAALDHLGIAHTDGLTDSEDVGKIAELDAKALAKLVTALEGAAPGEDVAIYLKFMGAKDVDAVMGAAAGQAQAG